MKALPRKRKQPARTYPASRTQTKSAIAQRKAAYLSVFEKTLCNTTEACKKMGISRSTPYDWMRNDTDFKEALEGLQESQVDLVEGELLKNIKRGNVTAQIFFLKCRGKHRGYVERQERTGPDGGPFQIEEHLMTDAELIAAMDGIQKMLSEK